MILKLKDGDVKIELFEDVAPNHVKRIKELAISALQISSIAFCVSGWLISKCLKGSLNNFILFSNDLYNSMFFHFCFNNRSDSVYFI